MSRPAAFSALLLVAALPGVIAAPAAIAAPEPVPVSPEKSELWGLPHDPLADDDVSLSLSSLEEIASGASATTPVGVGEQLQAQFRIDNRSASELSDVQVTVRRADAVNSADEAQAALAHSDFPYWGNAVNLASVAPNSSTSASMDISTALADSPSLSITQPGAYPVLFTLTGFQDGDPVHLASERLVLRVEGPADEGFAANDFTADDFTADDFTVEDTVANNSAENTAENSERGFSVIVPVSAQIDPVPGATGDDPLIVRSEDFTTQISAGGRLYELVEAYRNHDLDGAACMALDPAVVNMAARMTEGYYVNEQRPEINNEPVRLRDSWGADREPDLGDEGRGADAAREWLDMIRDVDCVLAMPWANTDLNAVQGTHDGWMLHEATDRGPELLQRVLGLESRPVLLPGNGYVSRETSYALGNLPEGAHALLADDAVPSAAAAIADTETNLRASTYDGALAAILSDTGASPVTAPYTPVEYRTGTAQASEHARDITAASMLRTAAQPAPDAATTIALLPALVEAPVAETLLSAAADVLAEPGVIPRPLDAAVGDNYVEQARAHEAAATVAETSGTASGSPYPDPSVFTDLEITQVRQQVRYINELMSIMRNDSDIALTRYEYTLALRRDMLVALSHHQRNTLDGYDAAVAATATRINANRAVLKELRESVSLAPPGNVYTRVSDSSPLLVVAKNQLPLPVTTQMAFDSPEGTRLNTPEQVSIPARGSITVSMTADIPADHGRTDIRLWLATPTGSGISQPVEITVNTRSDSVILYSVAAGLTLVLATAVALRVRRRRRN
ncbi:hypothetical protein COPR103792_05385 [Corynebacterium propinquum]|uniref:hypothetical protein n=1 Tax=Corynebacterium propinquum TaxID=43769 RepID=UPI00037EE498|nr:hypothetical protein [Corynebacterium propinquum]PZQ27069.1 MAG: hypothetical protein DI558_02030 [Corynebacterium propinquum]QQU89826.1 hypothetical protein I6I69_05595 [Corynebacterium propinquum]WKS35539.1 hypothetical protein NLL30_06620 [Corynebacterium propinquum]